MAEIEKWIPLIGPALFGSVVGWMTHLTFYSTRQLSVKTLGAIIGVIGGGAVTALFQDSLLFGAYCIGLGVAFFVRVVAAPVVEGVRDQMRKDEEREEDRRKARARKKGDIRPPAV
jgi:hypothetical protein